MQAQHGTHSPCVQRQYVGELYHGLKQRQNESPLATDTAQFKHSQRHFVFTSGYLAPSQTRETHPYNNNVRAKIQQPIYRRNIGN